MSPKTFENQPKLGRLPIPTLEETLARYLRSIEPLCTPGDLSRTSSYIADFLKPNGLGRTLQQRLIDLDRSSPHNWLDDSLWIRKAYHEWRESVVVNSNWYLMFVNDPNTPQECLGIVEKGTFGEWQVKRAAHLIVQILNYKESIDSERLPPDVTRLYPLCMYQYTRCYGVTRIPQHNCDALVHTPHPAVAKHILIIVRDQFYVIDVYDRNGRRLAAGDIEFQLQRIIDDVKKAELDPPVSVLTGDHRDSWTVAREHLLSIPQNRATLTDIEDALFAFSLDDYTSGLTPDDWNKNAFHGLNGHNRWFDKAMSFVIENNGRASLNGEHSPCDALIPSIIVDNILKEAMPSTLQKSGSEIPLPRRIRFVTDDRILKDIAAAQERVDKIIADSDAVLLHFKEYGTHFMKTVAKVAPDAYMQMVLQLAYYKLHGKVVPTYETGSTRQFLHGRTETIRTLSSESKAWVEAMENNSLSSKDKYNKFQVATKAHSQYTRDASNGKGCDRHLLGLRCCLKEGESHPLFTDPIFAGSQVWLLSTSGLSAGDRFTGTGFGCVYPNGYGINYLPGNVLLKFGIESKKSSTETDSNAFRQSVVNALHDMRQMCEDVNGKYDISTARL